MCSKLLNVKISRESTFIGAYCASFSPGEAAVHVELAEKKKEIVCIT